MSSGYWSRRLSRNVLLLVVAGVVYAAVTALTADSNQAVYRISMATGYASVALIAWAMLIGPWRVRGGRSAPVSTDLRRDAGIWGGLLGIAHVVTGLQVHMGGDMLKYFFFRDGEHRIPVRYDLFGFANWSGLAATLLLVMLLVISNDISLRLMGARRWKQWQRWTYVMAVVVVGHTFAYQLSEQGHAAYMLAFAIVSAIVLWLQLDGRRRVLTRGVAPASDATEGAAL
jgi:sulfoxide reductase heme-binding subunit YedZ